MGSAYNIGVMAKPVFQELMPDIDTRVMQPAEIEHLNKAIFPETDLGGAAELVIHHRRYG
jgi:hypothetical protein